MSEDEKEETRMEERYEAFKIAAAITYFEENFGTMPHPLKIFKFRRWLKDFEMFMEGLEFGGMLMLKMLREVRKNMKKKTIEVTKEDEERASY
ncbi:MAG: hypothetical protein DRI61_04490 [Chloroflexi bacterium]|nr:MAG: hypothetical protein DRI61_04490 [Chloroflexota bacterium]